VTLQSVVPGLAWLQSRSLGDSRVRVAVLDGPVDLSHPCFRGADLSQVHSLVQEPAGPGRMSRHGTHITSLLFGQPTSPVPGVAPRCQGLLIPVFRDYQEGRLPQLDLARAIEKAVLEGAHVINISGGERAPNGQPDSILERALRLCATNNVLVVAAAGNDGCACVHVPAAVPTVLAVGALGRNGRPLEVSNWGEPYSANGVLAPGDRLVGAIPGGATAEMTGTSFATPVVAGIAALLLSTQVDAGRKIDPRAVGEAILRTASTTCHSSDADECRHYLAGAVDAARAYTYINQTGRTTVADFDSSADSPRGPDGAVGQTGVAAAESVDTTASERMPAPSEPLQARFAGQADPGASAPAGSPTWYMYPPSYVYPYPPLYPPPAAVQGTPAAGAPAESVLPATTGQAVSPSSECACGGTNSGGVKGSDGCTCGGRSQGPTICDCQAVRTSYIYALGSVGFDFGTEARRDTFRQLMPDVERQDGGNPPVRTSANPYDVFQLSDYLRSRPSESTKLIWTLNLDLTPIYAIEPEPAYPEDVYSALRDALRAEALPADDSDYVARVSIPGALTNRTVQLFSGQIVPVVVVQPRGLYAWSENQVVDGVVAALQGQIAMDEEYVRRMIRTFLDKVYFECRNLGQSPSDRALNFAATNAYQFGAGIADGFLSGRNLVPGAEEELYTLDSIDVSKSPYCRMDSDCWDVRITFFDPVNDRRAKSVYQFTIDVSDQLPVTLAPYHRYLTT
jgi:cyanobactin maturation PatA/PatG family protease